MTTEPATRIAPPVSDESRAFWTGGATGELLIQWCAACARWVHPPVGRCPTCGSELEARPVSGRGTVWTFTVNRHPFHPAVPVPYVIAIVELVEQAGLRFITNIVDCEVDEVELGMPVEVCFEPVGDDVWVPVFRRAGVGSDRAIVP